MENFTFKGMKCLSAQCLSPRYLYLCVTSPQPHTISFSWRTKNGKYVTKPSYLHTVPAVYCFDLSIMRALDQSGRLKYGWMGEITDFHIITDEECCINWYSLCDRKTGFNELFPLVEIVDYPEVLHFEVTRNCNLRCYMCRENREQELQGIGMKNLDFSLFEKAIPFAQNVNNIALFGWGEPLVHPNFIDFVESVKKIKARNNPALVKSQKPYVNFTTNATLLTDALIRRLIGNEIDEIVVSIDSHNPAQYNFIRKNADFSRVMENLANFNLIKKEYGVTFPVLTIAVVAMRCNIDGLPEMIKLAAKLGSRRVLVNYLTVVTKGLEHESLFYHQDLANRLFDLTERVANENNVTVTLPARFGTSAQVKGYCDDIQEMFYIRAEGTVLGCCFTDYCIGDLREESCTSIWQGERRKQMIDNLREGILSGKCRNCHKFTGTDINVRETHIKV